MERVIKDYFHNDPVAQNALLAKLANYFEFVNRYGRHFRDLWNCPFWIEEVTRLDSLTLRFVGVNTVLFSGRNDRRGSLILGQNQYILPGDTDVAYVILFHHPLEWCKDGSEARRYLENRTRVWLSGHEHSLRVESAENVGGFKRIEVQAGATNPPAANGYQFRYNWLTFSLEMLEAGKHLVVTLWPRVWTTELTRFTADSNLLGGELCKEFSFLINKPDEKLRRDAMITYGDQSIEELADTDNENDYLSKVNIDMFRVKREDQDFRRMQFLFWKKLKRQERLTVLVELGLLPDLGYTLTPDWIRHGLEIARNTGKLYELWESMMRYIPPEQREANPFLYHEEEKG